jgi:hypothetical protein
VSGECPKRGGGEWGDSPPGPRSTSTTTACARNSLSGVHSVRESAGSGPSRVKTHLRPMIRRAGGRSECFGCKVGRAKGQNLQQVRPEAQPGSPPFVFPQETPKYSKKRRCRCKKIGGGRTICPTAFEGCLSCESTLWSKAPCPTSRY